MPLITGKPKTKYYTAQIYASGCWVYAEIVYTYDQCVIDGYYMVALNEQFGSMFNNSPKEKDYIKANKWVEEQLSLLERYTTNIITRPKILNNN